MVLNRVWIGMFVIAIVMGFSKLIFWQDTFILQKMMDALFEAAKSAFELALYMTGILALWMGLMNYVVRKSREIRRIWMFIS